MQFSGPILVTGGSGQIGGAVKALAEAHGIEVEAQGRDRLDLCDDAQLAAAVRARPWAAIINCAAYTAVDRAEEEPELAELINGRAPRILAEQAALHRIPIVHVSTDYVFNGSKSAPYNEADPIDPLGVYGRTKAMGEAAVSAAGGAHAIVRTAWVLGPGNRNFLDTMLRLAGERDEIKIVDDQHGSPTSAEDVAQALLRIASELGDRQGIWHCVNGGEASWYEVACHIFQNAGSLSDRVPRLTRISTAEYPTPACRPANSRLDTSKLSGDFGVMMRPWQEAVDAILAVRRGRLVQ
jgi:dTDP-4-dehydrorhamnose reductase